MIDRYEAKQRYADRIMRDNATIETLSEEQHAALADICRIRHYLHSTPADRIFSSESAESDNWFRELSEINDILTASGLMPIDISLSEESVPSDIDWYYVMSDEEKEQYENFEAYYDIAIEQIARIKEEINSKIEIYLAAIDNEHGTKYCPTGNARFI